MHQLKVQKNIEIEDMIYEIRGKQVMLDSDLAKLYGVETRILNQAVKRNIERFPDEFCFQLTQYEYTFLKSQIVILENQGRGKHRKFLPFVFTEAGVSMLSAVLRSSIAIEMSVKIINTFVSMRKYIKYSNNTYNKRLSNIETKMIDYDNKFIENNNILNNLLNNIYS